MVTSYEEKDLADIFLPVGQMLQVHKIGHVSDGKIVGERRISEEDWFFPLHFPSDPIFPGSLLIEGAGQVVAIWGWASGLRGKPRLVKVAAEFRSPVSPCDYLLTYVGTVKKRNNICMGRVEIKVGERFVAEVSVTLVVLDE